MSNEYKLCDSKFPDGEYRYPCEKEKGHLGFHYSHYFGKVIEWRDATPALGVSMKEQENNSHE